MKRLVEGGYLRRRMWFDRRADCLIGDYTSDADVLAEYSMTTTILQVSWPLLLVLSHATALLHMMLCYSAPLLGGSYSGPVSWKRCTFERQ